jgi:hypothetical protein
MDNVRLSCQPQAQAIWNNKNIKSRHNKGTDLRRPLLILIYSYLNYSKKGNEKKNANAVVDSWLSYRHRFSFSPSPSLESLPSRSSSSLALVLVLAIISCLKTVGVLEDRFGSKRSAFEDFTKVKGKFDFPTVSFSAYLCIVIVSYPNSYTASSEHQFIIKSSTVSSRKLSFLNHLATDSPSGAIISQSLPSEMSVKYVCESLLIWYDWHNDRREMETLKRREMR